MSSGNNILSPLVASMLLIALAGCNTASIAPLAISAAGAAGGYLAGGAIDDSEGAKLGGMAVGLIAASQAYEYLDKGDGQKILEAYEQGKREARTETSNAYWRAVTGADGSEYNEAADAASNLKYRQIQYDPHATEGVVYGSSYVPKDVKDGNK